MNADATELPLAKLAKAELEWLRKAIVQRRLGFPLSQLGLESVGKGTLFGRLGVLAGAGPEAALAMIDLALATREVSSGAAIAAELVWTGPDVRTSAARPTTAALLDLLGRATSTVLVWGYVFDHGRVVFAPLHRVMSERGVKATICLDVPPPAGARMLLDSHLALRSHQFLAENWPFGPPWPELWYWCESCVHGGGRSLHAKCVVVDGTHVLVGSANFTRRGHTRNVEVGIRVEDRTLAQALTTQFDALRARGDLKPLPVVAGTMATVPVEAEDEADGEREVNAAPSATGRDGETLADELFVDPAARSLFVRLVASGVPLPAVGEDVEGDGGEVLGSTELTWEEPRVAVLLPEQEGSRRKLEAAGWTCLPVALDAAGWNTLVERVGREG